MGQRGITGDVYGDEHLGVVGELMIGNAVRLDQFPDQQQCSRQYINGRQFEARRLQDLEHFARRRRWQLRQRWTT